MCTSQHHLPKVVEISVWVREQKKKIEAFSYGSNSLISELASIIFRE